MGMSTSFAIGPLVICNPAGKKPFDVVEITKERLCRVYFEGDTNIYNTYHVFAPNRSGYTVDLNSESDTVLLIEGLVGSGFPVVIPGIEPIVDTRKDFVEAYYEDIENIIAYYGMDAVRIVFAAYAYTS